jgi:hypothetical protein
MIAISTDMSTAIIGEAHPRHKESPDSARHRVPDRPWRILPRALCRRYVLEFQTGRPIFCDAYTGTVFPRSDRELALDRIIDEVFDDGIVPQKLAKAFPGSTIGPRRY